MAEASPTGPNHGSQVSEYVHFLQEQREAEGGHRGIGREVSEFASGGKAGGPADDEDTDNGLQTEEVQILIVRDGEIVLDADEKSQSTSRSRPRWTPPRKVIRS